MLATITPGEELRNAVSFQEAMERKFIQYSGANLGQQSVPRIPTKLRQIPAIQRLTRYLTVDRPTTLKRKGRQKVHTMYQTDAFLCPGAFSERDICFADGFAERK